MVKKVILWCAVILVSCQIFGFSSKTAAESSGLSSEIAEKVVKIIEKVIEPSDSKKEEIFSSVHFLIRKSAHFCEFTLLAILVFFLARSYKLSIFLCILIALGYSLLFAVSDEVHQLFVDGRSGQITDVLVDFAGSMFGAGISFLCLKVFDRK